MNSVKNIGIKSRCWVLLLTLVSLLGMAQQQPLYTNIMLNQYLYNPAYAGVDTGTTFIGTYRNQWVGFDGAPKTYALSGYGNFKKRVNMTVGGLVTTEKIGLFQQTGFYGSYTYKLKINKKYAISFGLSVGAMQYNVKAYNARPYDADDGFLQSPTLNGLAFDASAGFYFYSRKFFLGFSNQHMPNSRIQWDNTQGRLTPHFYAYSGYNIFFNKKGDWILQPSVLYRTDNPAQYQLDYNLKLLYHSMFWIGGTYRDHSSLLKVISGKKPADSYDHSALCALIGIKVNGQFTFAYSYDYTLSKLANYSSGTHEIVLSYLIPFKKKKTAAEKAKDADEEELNKIDNTLKTNIRSKKKEEKDKAKNNKPSEETKPENPNGAGTKDLRKSQKKNDKETKFKKEKNKHYKKSAAKPLNNNGEEK